jgi:hypothetical protein
MDVLCHPLGRFRRLENVTPVVDSRGEADFRAGSRSVIFPVSTSSGKFAMKCYTKIDVGQGERLAAAVGYLNRLNAQYLIRSVYLDDEVYVFDSLGRGGWRPVLLAEWVEGCSLRSWLADRCAAKEGAALRAMAERFARLGLWLLEQEWAHGDLKPDNIIVAPDGTLRLIDYDNVFVPQFAGALSPELGTPGFQHPARDAKLYDARMDDYSIALISCALYALSEFPEWYAEGADGELLLFDPPQAVAGRDGLLQRLRAHWLDEGRTALYRLASLAGSPSPVLPELPEVLRHVLEAPRRQADSAGIYRCNGFYGYTALTEAIYDDVAPFADGLALVRLGKKRFFIDTTGRKRIDVTMYRRADSFSESLAAVQKGDKWGYIDTTGAWVIAPAFERALAFRQGAAVVGLNGRYGYIDRRGRWLTEPVYTFATPFRNGVAHVEADGVVVELKLAEKKNN